MYLHYGPSASTPYAVTHKHDVVSKRNPWDSRDIVSVHSKSPAAIRNRLVSKLTVYYSRKCNRISHPDTTLEGVLKLSVTVIQRVYKEGLHAGITKGLPAKLQQNTLHTVC
ncbi:hypothetical protein J6590_009721 [Homalodisca vitripennis]|nr:hypothetical protein J6590_009721 [Homalodisca vitripennis]